MITAEDALAEAERAMDGPFVRGACDCCTAACAAFAKLHGIDPAARWRGRYSTGDEADAIIAEHGGPIRFAVDVLTGAGLVRRAPDDARPGDLALVRQLQGMALGLALGDGLFAVKSPDGMAIVPARRAHGCWGLP